MRLGGLPAQALRNKRVFGPLALALFGRSFDGYPLDFFFVGQDSGVTADVVQAKSNDGFVMRLFVDAAGQAPSSTGCTCRTIARSTVSSGRSS